MSFSLTARTFESSNKQALEGKNRKRNQSHGLNTAALKGGRKKNNYGNPISRRPHAKDNYRLLRKKSIIAWRKRFFLLLFRGGSALMNPPAGRPTPFLWLVCSVLVGPRSRSAETLSRVGGLLASRSVTIEASTLATESVAADKPVR